jgi:hypothetical protein
LTFANALTAPGLVNKIIVDPRDSKDIYVGGTLVMNPFPIDPNFVLRSKDGGVTFMPADAGLKVELLAFGIDPVEPTRLFAMCPAGLFETADGGTNWSLLDPGGETFLREPDQLAVNPRQPRLLYLGGLSLLEVETKR